MNFSRLFSWILIQGLLFTFAVGEKILIFHGVASYSHRVQTMPLAEALSKRGHEVTYISPFHPKKANPNITEIVPISVEKYVDEFLNSEFDINLRIKKIMEPVLDFSMNFAYTTCETLMASPEFKNWLSVNKKFDLIIADNCYAECGLGLAHKLSAKSIIFSTITTIAYEYDAFGFVPESSAIPEMEIDPPIVPMGFLDRVSNAIMSLRWYFHYSKYSSKVDHLLRTSLQIPNMPYISELMSNVNLIFYTGDAITDYPRALPPNFVNIAGIHCKESTDALPEDIENFINPKGTKEEDNDGFVYISLGSVAVSSLLPEEIKQIFFQTMKSFPKLKFLWKWNGDFPKDIPDNLFLGKWFPQIDILGHNKIRAFVTQSGRPSTLEALFNGVPMISFPILGDQDFNANRLAEVEATVRLEIGTVTLQELKDAIRKTVYDPTTKARLIRMQTIFRDRPMSPVETAVWYTEYVLRTEDTSHLLPAGHNQNWFVRRQIDVWAFLSISLFVITICTIVILIKVLRSFLTVQPKLKSS